MATTSTTLCAKGGVVMADVKSCETCAYIGKSENDYPCNKCTRNASDKWKQMTNADKIRSMSDEELAEFFSERDKIPNRYKCKEIEDWIKWLQSEAE